MSQKVLYINENVMLVKTDINIIVDDLHGKSQVKKIWPIKKSNTDIKCDTWDLLIDNKKRKCIIISLKGDYKLIKNQLAYKLFGISYRGPIIIYPS